ncbi:MAG: hypothetical protein ACLT2T_03845 [Bilophila wadsworthia]
MNPLMLIKGELRRSFGGILALALVLALSLSLGVGVSMTERAVRQGTARAGDAFDLLVGAQGSSVQLMLGAVYLRPSRCRWFRGRGYGNSDAGRRRLGRAAGLRRPLERVPAGGRPRIWSRSAATGRSRKAGRSQHRTKPYSARVSPRLGEAFSPCTGRSPHPTTNTDMSATRP